MPITGPKKMQNIPRPNNSSVLLLVDVDLSRLYAAMFFGPPEASWENVVKSGKLSFYPPETKRNITHREAKAKDHAGISSRYLSRDLSTCPDLNHEVSNSDSGQRCPSSTKCFASEHPSTADVAFRVNILRLSSPPKLSENIETFHINGVCRKPKGYIYICKTFQLGTPNFF